MCITLLTLPLYQFKTLRFLTISLHLQTLETCYHHLFVHFDVNQVILQKKPHL